MSGENQHRVTSMKKSIVFIIFFLIGWGILFTEASSAEVKHSRLDPVDDPYMLPYRFTTTFKYSVPRRKRAKYAQWYVPIDLFNDGKLDLYVVTNDWRQRDTSSNILFFRGIIENKTISQVNVRTPYFFNNYPFDYDCDNVVEVAVTYRWHDSLWLEILDPFDKSIYKRLLVAGRDHDGNGFWDGSGLVVALFDVNHDGYMEIFASIDTGYDLYPRKLVCIDWFNDTLLWEFNISGTFGKEQIAVTRPSPTDEPLVIFTVTSKGNAARAGDMDDNHAYLIVLNLKGKLLWKKIIGGTFFRSDLNLFDFNHDGTKDICIVNRKERKRPGSPDQYLYTNSLKVFDKNGKLLKALPFKEETLIRELTVLDLDDNGHPELYLSFSDHSLMVLNDQLETTRSIQCYALLSVLGAYDFIGSREKELIIQTFDNNKLWLLDSDFKPLAQFTSLGRFGLKDFTAYRKADGHYAIILGTDNGHTTYFLSLTKSPWNTIFFRQPLVTSLVTFVPMSLVILLIWYNWYRTRKQKQVISRQRDRLDSALAELKAAQSKLVAIEEYRKTYDALKERLRYEEALAYCSKQLVEIPDLHEVFNLVVRKLCSAVDVSRAYIFKNIEDLKLGTCMSQIVEAVAEGIEPQIDNPVLKLFPYSQASSYLLETLQAGKPYRGIVRELPESDRAVLEEQGIRSLIILPIYTERKLWGFIGFDDCKQEREWKDEDVRLLQTIAEMLGAAIGRKQVEESLDFERRQLVSIFDSTAEAVYVSDPETYEILYANEKIKELFGNCIGKTCYEVFQGLDSPCSFCTNKHIFGENVGKPYIWEFQNVLTSRWYRCIDRAIRWPDGRMVRYELAIDITDRIKAEEALRESEARYRTLFENANDAIFLETADEQIIAVNRKACELSGYSREELLKMKTRDLKPPEEKDRPKHEIYTHPEKSFQQPEERVLLRRDGVRVFTEFSITSLKVGGETLFLSILRDITERKKTEAREKARLELLYDLRRASNVDTCLELGCKAIYNAGLYKRSVLTLHNEKREITNIGYFGLDPEIIRAARNAPAPDKELAKQMTQERFRISHSYFIPEEASLPLLDSDRYVPQSEKDSERKTTTWKPGDELFVPILGDSDRYEGWLSVDTPFDGQRPTLEVVTLLEQIVDIVTQKVREILTLQKLREGHIALRAERDYSARIINGSPAIVCGITPEGTITFVNPAGERFTGYTAAEIVGKAWWEIFHTSRQRSSFEQLFLKEEKRDYEVELTSLNGEKRIISWSSVNRFDETGQLIELIGFGNDITDRKRAEEELRSERDFVRSLLDTANSMIVCLDDQARITVFNRESEKITGYTREEVLGKKWPDLFLPKEYRHDGLKNFAEWVRTHPVDVYEGPLVTKSGEVRTMLWSNSALFSGSTLTAIAVGQDITDRKEAQRQLYLANQERYNQVKQIAGGIAHEIHNALYPATSSLAKLRQRLFLFEPDEIKRNEHLLSLAEKAVTRAMSMTELVTKYSRLDTEKKEEQTNLTAVLREIVNDNKLRIEEVGATVRLDMPNDAICICRYSHAYSLFNNLLINALDAVAESKRKEILLVACKEEKFLRIELSDTGHGIPEESKDKVFSAFFSTKPQTGTGLGLAIVKKIVELYEGNIEVKSSLDKGTKFTILLKSL